MRKIINGKKYNTLTAASQANFNDGRPKDDFQHLEETLYLKKTGEYFLHGKGHGSTEYGEDWPSGGRGWGEKIIPLSYDEALDWASRRLDVDEVEDLFGEVAE